MQHLKVQVPFSSGGTSHIFSIDENNSKLGVQDGINDTVKGIMSNSINGIIDGERFISNWLSSTIFTAKFYDPNINDFTDDISFLDFDTKSFLKSFYILDFYDSTTYETQNKLASTYFMLSPAYSTNTTYNFDYFEQLNMVLLPQYFIKNRIFNGLNIVPIYLKLSFYNAKDGYFSTFYNESLEGDKTQDLYYYEVKYNIEENHLYTTSDEMVFKQLVSVTYNKKLNEGTPSMEILNPEYPKGNTYLNGNYFNSL